MEVESCVFLALRGIPELSRQRMAAEKKNGNDHAEASQSAWTKLYAARASCTQIQKDLALGTKFIGSLAPTAGGGPAGGGG